MREPAPYRRMASGALLWALLTPLVGLGQPLPPPDRVGPSGQQIILLGAEAPGFDQLTPRERALTYVLARAALAGDRIFLNQVHPDATDAVALLDTLDAHAAGLDEAVRTALRSELVRALVHHGPYDQRTHRKHTSWGLTPALLEGALQHAQKGGAPLPLQPGESLDALKARLFPVLTDPSHEAVHVEQRAGADIVRGSWSNLYGRGVTLPMVQGLLGYWQEKINVRMALDQDGRLGMEVFRVGGRHGEALADVVFWLQKALPLAEEGSQKQSIHALVDFYRTGDEALFREHSVHWLQTRSRVDYLNGFVEQYLDPRGVIGAFAANVSFRAKGDLPERLALLAEVLETRMPWERRWQRVARGQQQAALVNVLVETGDAGPLTAAAYSLPNDNDLRRDVGSRNVVLLNAELARSDEDRRALIGALVHPRDRALLLEHGDEARLWHLALHEVVGHPSGQQDPTAAGSERVLQGRTFAALEECRADLVALYHVGDPQLLKAGLFRDQAHQEAVHRALVVQHLTQDLMDLRTDADTVLRQAHRRGRHLATQWLLTGGGRKRDLGVRLERVDGQAFVRVTDLARVHAGVGELLGLLQRHKSLAQDGPATALFESLGTHTDPALRDEVVARTASLNLPRQKALVFPRWVPVVQGGAVVDAVPGPAEDFVSQQRRFRRLGPDRLWEPGP